MADRGALDVAITTLGTETANLISLAQQLIAKGQSASLDYTSEIDQLNQIGKNVNNALSSANAAAAAPDVPQAQAPAPTTTTQPTTDQQEATGTPEQG